MKYYSYLLLFIMLMGLWNIALFIYLGYVANLIVGIWAVMLSTILWFIKRI